MNCDAVVKSIPLYFYGEVAPDAEDAIEEHLGTCAPCREEWERQKALAGGPAAACPIGHIQGALRPEDAQRGALPSEGRQPLALALGSSRSGQHPFQLRLHARPFVRKNAEVDSVAGVAVG